MSTERTTWAPRELREGTPWGVPGWYAFSEAREGHVVTLTVYGPFESEAQCAAKCAELNREAEQPDAPAIVIDGGRDADSYKLNPGGHRA